MIKIIAEIGTAHNGSIDKAYRLIDKVAECGGNYAKFQIVFADEIIHKNTGVVDLPGGKISLYHRFKELEKDEDFFRQLKTHTEKQGLKFLCTPFGIKSARILKNLGIDEIKIASPELNHFQLLKEVAGYGVKIVLSTGVSTLGDIEAALRITGPETTLLHCVTSYPAPEEEYNLNLLKVLNTIFGTPIGISDHSRDPVLIPALSTASGAHLIEKHFTLSATDSGLDDKTALTPPDFKKMVQGIRKAESLGEKETIKWLSRDYGPEKIKKILGTGKKSLAESEKSNYKTTRRSIHALNFLSSGTFLSEENIAPLRSEKNLSPGISPEFLSLVYGKILKKDIASGEGLSWEHLL